MRYLACLLWLPWLAAGARAAGPSPEAGRDPFAPPASTREGEAPMPLRRHALAQLRLAGTVCGIGLARALIEDPSGLGFVVVAGDVVGAEGGRVTSIGPGRVVIDRPGSTPLVLRTDGQGKSGPNTQSQR